MKRFVFLWGSLLLALVILAYTITMCFFFSAWFLLLVVPSVFMVIKLIYNIGIQAKVLTQAQKNELSGAIFRQGYISLLISIWCGIFIMRHPYEECIYSTTFGIALFCFFGLCLALRNYLGSFNSL